MNSIDRALSAPATTSFCPDAALVRIAAVLAPLLAVLALVHAL